MTPAEASDHDGPVDSLIGASVLDLHAVPVGRVRALLVDPARGAARWFAVELCGGGGVVVPARAASAGADGRLVVPYSDEVLRGAPPVAGEVVTTEEAGALLRYFGFPPDDAADAR